MGDSDKSEGGDDGLSRRDLITTGVAGGSVLLAAGFAVAHAARFLNPPTRTRSRETFVAFAAEVPERGTLEVVLPDGRRVAVKRTEEGFSGFSNVCPHLSCRVHWVPAAEKEEDPKKKEGYFRCPCHEGLFTPNGAAFSGPPADAGQSLSRVPLVQIGNALYVRFEEQVS